MQQERTEDAIYTSHDWRTLVPISEELYQGETAETIMGMLGPSVEHEVYKQFARADVLRIEHKNIRFVLQTENSISGAPLEEPVLWAIITSGVYIRDGVPVPYNRQRLGSN